MPLTKNEIKLIKSYHQKKNREQDKVFIVEGEKMVTELFLHSDLTIKNVYFTNQFDHALIPENVTSLLITEKELERISNLKSANKVLAIVKQKNSHVLDTGNSDLILALDTINDPGNLGTIIRTADWFGISQIITTPKTVELFNPKVIQSSMGAIYRVNFLISQDLVNDLKELKKLDYKLVGANMNGENLHSFNKPKKTVLVMGSESHGISDNTEEILDHTVTIPKFGKTESLNVAIATGIIINEFCK